MLLNRLSSGGKKLKGDGREGKGFERGDHQTASHRRGIAANVFSMFSSTASVDLTPAYR